MSLFKPNTLIINIYPPIINAIKMQSLKFG